jgi:pyridoxamine 5'-phosphate oxidase
MDFQEYTRFANEVRTFYLATVEGDQPRVRAMGLHQADETGFTFFTESVKAVYKQLQNNRKVELCFHSTKPGPDAGKVMRVSGEVEFIDDIATRTQILEKNPFLKNIGVSGPEDSLMVVCRISKGEAFFWTFASNMKEAEIERIKFGE